MYCFSHMCRICLSTNKQGLVKINAFDKDKIRIRDKLKFCIPEIDNTNYNLPDRLCRICFTKLKKAYKFKTLCLKNEDLLNKHAAKLTNAPKLSRTIKSERSDLRVKMVDMKNSLVNMQTKENNRENNTLSVQTTSEDSEGVSMYSISLNQWDLFETKFTCRCVKEFNSFTEETRHLCKNCEGGLLGFRLSKIKVGLAQDKYSLTDELNKSLDSSRGSVTSESSNSNRKVDKFNDSANSELGFDYNDILLCKVHVNGVKKQINSLRSIAYTEYSDKTIDRNIEKNLDSHSDNPSDSDCSETPNSSFEEENRHNSSTDMVSVSDKPYQCKLCSKGYTRRYNLISHYANHPEAQLYDCTKCKKKFIDCEERDEHELTHKKSVDKEHTKSIDTTPNATKTEFRRRSVASDNEDEDMEVDELDEIQYNGKLELNSTDENITCGTCDRSFSHKSHLAIHLMTHMGKQEFKCDTCSKQFFRKDNYDQHVLMHTTPRKFDCPECGRSFTQKSNMHRHYRNHAVEKFICSVCTKCFARKDILERHILSHAQSTERMYQCTQCDKSYNYPQNLKKHMRKHNVQVFKCTTCDAEFNMKELLEEHINQHRASKSYCSICDRIFSKTTNMKRHKLRHTNDKVFTCETCNKTFRSEFNLKQHSLSHNENVERFECTHCDKTYASKSGLTRHIFSHTS